MRLRVIAGLCNGSTPDSDSVCEGSNPSPAAKTGHQFGAQFFVSGPVCRKKAVMLWRYTLASGSYCGSADGRSISLQENADWRNPRLAISLDEIHAPPLRPLRRSAVDLASQCHSFSQMRIWWN